MAEVLSKKKTVAKKSTAKSKAKPKYSKKQYLSWFEIMYRVRKFEERTLYAYSQQKIRGFCHVYIGQEAIAAGLTSGITKEDKLVTAYRQHGVALARGLDSNSCMAELFGKSTGCVKGKGGSMHFFSKDHNYFGGNGIVGAQIPIGTGIAFAEQYRGTKNLCVTMFGDGAARQGALYESFNMAMTWKLPVLYICENNKYAMGTSVERTSNVQELYKIGSAFDMPSEPVDGMSPEAVHEALLKAAKHIRSGKGPYYLEINTYRYRGHSVSDPAKYRTKDELNEYKEKDPIVLIVNKMIDTKLATQAEIDKIKVAIDQEIEDALKFAEESDFPLGSELYDDNYVQKDYPFIVD
ncbi:MAG: pyruvate dehydrogenase (acetyl-transferring) E1 component subunit alpha [Saprospiraceae bacterium]|nr:pyruvate dehydrogenase (acetyl-transferring) E1 component subunit alpha [Saprospiraceae bacterium]